VIFAIFFGFGWFFLFQSIIILLTHIPPFDRITRKILIGEQGELEAKIQTSTRRMVFVSYFLRINIFLAYVGLTIIAFTKVNISFIELFR